MSYIRRYGTQNRSRIGSFKRYRNRYSRPLRPRNPPPIKKGRKLPPVARTNIDLLEFENADEIESPETTDAGGGSRP